jgi:predicted RNase H-like nuclease (RuvC/YqgF family)
MPAEDHKSQKKIQCWIPLETWDRIVSMGYTSPTIAVTKAFEKLLKDPQQIPPASQEIPVESLEIPELKIKNEELERQIKNLKENLRKAPDSVELAQLHTRYEELEKYNQALKKELDKQLGEKEKEVDFLKGQITIKDQQLDKQAFSLQSIIQENSRLNLKLLPENTEVKKKPFWKFW